MICHPERSEGSPHSGTRRSCGGDPSPSSRLLRKCDFASSSTSFGHLLPRAAGEKDLAPRRTLSSMATRRASCDLRMTLSALLLLLAANALAQVVAATDHGVLVARSGSIEMFDRRAANLLWSGDGVAAPETIVTSADHAAVIDPLANQVRIVDLATGRGSTMQTGETPIDGLFVGHELYLLERDARVVERIGTEGARASISVAADPAFLRPANGRLYVYSRGEGVIQEIITSPLAVRRSAKAAPFASDFEVDGRNAYVVSPRAAKIGVISLSSMKPTGNIAVGAVPVDLAFISRSDRVDRAHAGGRRSVGETRLDDRGCAVVHTGSGARIPAWAARPGVVRRRRLAVPHRNRSGDDSRPPLVCV